MTKDGPSPKIIHVMVDGDLLSRSTQMLMKQLRDQNDSIVLITDVASNAKKAISGLAAELIIPDEIGYASKKMHEAIQEALSATYKVPDPRKKVLPFFFG